VNTETLRGRLHVGEESLHASLGLLSQDYSTSAYILEKKNRSYAYDIELHSSLAYSAITRFEDLYRHN
jgi:hypothetical protein